MQKSRPDHRDGVWCLMSVRDDLARISASTESQQIIYPRPGTHLSVITRRVILCQVNSFPWSGKELSFAGKYCLWLGEEYSVRLELRVVRRRVLL
jgi:hypothetical protein